MKEHWLYQDKSSYTMSGINFATDCLENLSGLYPAICSIPVAALNSYPWISKPLCHIENAQSLA